MLIVEVKLREELKYLTRTRHGAALHVVSIILDLIIDDVVELKSLQIL